MADRTVDGMARTQRVGAHPLRQVLPRSPRRLKSTTRSFKVGEGKGYLTVACTADGSPAAVTISMAKQGSTMAGLMDGFSTTITQGLRHQVPLEAFVREYVSMRFEPACLTNDPEIKQATSVLDYVGRRLALDFLPYDTRVEFGVLTAEERVAKELQDNVGDVAWTDMIGLAMSAPTVTSPRRG
ncbi:ribonucleoside-diphosphate reductase [Streptomyces sp. ADI98-10]|uniref:TSCPD domain-containing protein n=1 Tax=Streptomyces sp. ADI98-10 TaxID=1522763 RepID=UPI000F554AE4|nr:ribonucleoside-diphosphate reductase [Streptomyces sp. ADI98-10]RPK92291.1 Vitamin B12-dependent ribonucleotide reductase [Streptomyces sp. ADI98-10]